ncbi:hypothetical protein [Sporomusa sphaeroides]|uniref:hypothetical protein n=1 Tax=Sporomusa sphaeroides TaxID=47679 RepID=UPI002B6F1499|nr:hypothetical protein [Sporomusa sphaeroides]HML33151.1 hypothetical protein [Sporomusa sphaeroides]
MDVRAGGLVKKIVFLLLLAYFSTTASAGYAITPLRVAVMPPMNTADYRPQQDIQILQDTIKKPFKYPYYTLLPADMTAEAAQSLLAENKQARLSDEIILSAVADALSADIVVVVELDRARQQRFYSHRLDDTYVQSDIIVKCYAYSAATKQYDIMKANKNSVEGESVQTSPEVIFKDLAEEILIKLPYKRIPPAQGSHSDTVKKREE